MKQKERKNTGKLNKRAQNVYQKNKRFSLDGRNIAQCYTIKIGKMTLQTWTAFNAKMEIYNQYFVK